jgi:acetyl-CoA carboxylase biotin carboxyl carrier protein
MMELESLYQLMERFSRSGLTTLEWRTQGEEIVLKREGTPTAPVAPPISVHTPKPEAEAAPVEQGEDLVTAPLVGTFYAAPGPGETPFVSQGQEVTKGQTLCIIEAMKMMSEIAAPFDGVVTEILAQDSQPVGYGEPLLRIRRN